MRITSAGMVSGIVHALTDEYARFVILAVTVKAVYGEQLTQESEMPIGACHSRLH